MSNKNYPVQFQIHNQERHENNQRHRHQQKTPHIPTGKLSKIRQQIKYKALPQDETDIAQVLIKLQANGLNHETIKNIDFQLCELSACAVKIKNSEEIHTGLSDPEAVKLYISNRINKLNNKPSAPVYKNNFLKTYNQYTLIKGIEWNRPFYKSERQIPILPTKQTINIIIAGVTFDYQVIFSILEDAGIEGKELETVNQNHIDQKTGLISFLGCKGHNNRTIKLKQQTTVMLREYLAKHTEENPFPKSKRYGAVWNRAKKRLAKRLNKPELLKSDVRHLRHYSLTEFYRETRDILATQVRAGHKKLENTMLYVQLVEQTQIELKWASKVIQNTDINALTKASDEGYTIFKETETYTIVRKRIEI